MTPPYKNVIIKIPEYGFEGHMKINKKFVAIGIDKRGNMDYIYTVRVYTDLDQ